MLTLIIIFAAIANVLALAIFLPLLVLLPWKEKDR